MLGGATTAHSSTLLSFESCTFISTFLQSSIILVEDTRLLLKKPSSSFLPNLLLVAPVQVWLRYLVPQLTPLSQESTPQPSHYNKADGLLHGNRLQHWVPLFAEFAEAIRHKLNRPKYGELLFQNVRIICFLYCKIDETCTPGTGPMNNEELAERRPDAEIIQRALYSGYLKVHGMKVLTVVFPNGIITYLYGPVSARENDISLLNLSWLNEHLVALQPEITAAWANGENLLYFSLYGDKIFLYLQCITHAHEAF